MPDTTPVDFATPVGRVRKYIPDLVQLPDPSDPDGTPSYLFSDAEIQSFLDDETNSNTLPVTNFRVRRAAAWAMIALANSENLILKKITTQDQQTDGPSVAKQLLAAAAALMAQAQADEAAANAATEPETFTAVFPEPVYTSDPGYAIVWLR